MCEATCQIIHNRKLTKAFEMRTTERQGCLLSPMIFLMVVDWIMRETVNEGKTGIQWMHLQCFEDMDFTDDLCITSQRHQDIKKKQIAYPNCSHVRTV